jgi:integrase
MSSQIIVQETNPPLATVDPLLRGAFEVMAYGLTETSKRQYRHSFEAWGAWCADTRTAPYDLSATNIIHFLDSIPLARKTKMARLTHLRRLAQTLHTRDVSDPTLRQNYEQLQLLKLPKDDQAGTPRERKALAPDQVFEALKHWPTHTRLGKRNRALLAVLFYTGLRRSEAVDLKWSDIDLEQGLLTVRHGKGNKERTIGFASDKALDYLYCWRAEIPDYEHVFVAVNKGDNAPTDEPISTETVRRVTMASGDFKPHDARRTLITRMLLSGTALPDAQYTAGHANGATTMGYAVIKDAKEVKGRIRIDY